ncbi:MAG: glycosyltransferase, partial [Patescibacteria group bacterium]
SSHIENVSPKKMSSALYAKLTDLNPDVVLAGAIAFPSGATATRWAKAHNKGVVTFDDSRLEDIQRNSIINWVKQKIYNNVDAMFYPSEDWDATAFRWKFKKHQLFYGVDVVNNSFWQEKAKNINIYLPSNYLLMIGRQIDKKNILFLLRAYHQYIRQFKSKPYPLVLVGNGEQNNKIKEFINHYKLNDYVYLFDFMDQNSIKYIYQQASAFILPSKEFETWGLVVNEAMASGLPVLVSNKCGCCSTLVKNGINGFVFNPLSIESITNALVSFTSLSGQEKLEMGINSRNIIKSWDLDRFCQGAYEAALFAYSHKNKCKSLIEKLILQFWNGRYRSI